MKSDADSEEQAFTNGVENAPVISMGTEPGTSRRNTENHIDIGIYDRPALPIFKALLNSVTASKSSPSSTDNDAASRLSPSTSG